LIAGGLEGTYEIELNGHTVIPSELGA
jgi:hypothetical protein